MDELPATKPSAAGLTFDNRQQLEVAQFRGRTIAGQQNWVSPESQNWHGRLYRKPFREVSRCEPSKHHESTGLTTFATTCKSRFTSFTKKWAVGWIPKIKIPAFIQAVIGGRTRARTWDPMIKSLTFTALFQWLSCKFRGFNTHLDQYVTCQL